MVHYATVKQPTNRGFARSQAVIPASEVYALHGYKSRFCHAERNEVEYRCEGAAALVLAKQLPYRATGYDS